MSTISARTTLLTLALAALPLTAAGLALATPASASWPAGGMLVSSPGDINGVRNARILQLPSGDLFVIGVGSGGSSNQYNVQRISTIGVIGTGWPADGVRFSPVIKGTKLYAQSFVVDDAAHTWHSWGSASTSLQAVAADASAAPVPAGTAYNLGNPGGGPSHAAPAPGGEVFVTCGSSRLKRITATGAASAGWSSTGVGLPGTAFDDNALLPDGSGGVVVFMRSLGGTTPAAMRIDGNGLVHAGWSSGLPLSGVSAGADLRTDSQLLPAGPDHALAVWSIDAGSGTRRLMMQRFALDGTLDPAWPEDGLEVVAPDTLNACRALADGLGGAYIVRESHGHPLATHISAAGTMLATDVEFVDAGAQYLPNLIGVFPNTVPDDMIADATPDGGLLVGWNDTRLAPAVSFRLRWLTPSLTPAADKPDTGLVFFPASTHPTPGTMLALHADGADAAFIAWGDYHSIGFNQTMGDLWMTRVQAPAVTGVPRPGNGPSALSLSAPRPNPARGSVAFDVTLPDDSPVRVELVDVAGRVLRTQTVQGAGTRAVAIADLASFPPGLYFLRAEQARGTAWARVVLTR